VKKLTPYLSGKDFLVETDHRNLVYMERSEVAILIRWRLFLQQFQFKIRHIKGVDNVVADTFSRLFPDTDEHERTEDAMLAHTQEEITEFEEAKPEVHSKSKTKTVNYGYTARVPEYDKLIDRVHGHDNLHMGQRYTWRKLAMLFPGHFVPQQYVNYYVQQCAVCQKLREHNKLDTYRPRQRNLKVNDPRKRIAIDAIYMKTSDANGNSRAHVIINHFTKLVFIYPCQDLNARTSESVDQENETLEIDEVTVKGMIAEMLKKQDEIFESLTTRIGKIESEQQRLKILEGYPHNNR